MSTPELHAAVGSCAESKCLQRRLTFWASNEVAFAPCAERTAHGAPRVPHGRRKLATLLLAAIAPIGRTQATTNASPPGAMHGTSSVIWELGPGLCNPDSEKGSTSRRLAATVVEERLGEAESRAIRWGRGLGHLRHNMEQSQSQRRATTIGNRWREDGISRAAREGEGKHQHEKGCEMQKSKRTVQTKSMSTTSRATTSSAKRERERNEKGGKGARRAHGIGISARERGKSDGGGAPSRTRTAAIDKAYPTTMLPN